jgi:hypothetical protein
MMDTLENEVCSLMDFFQIQRDLSEDEAVAVMGMSIVCLCKNRATFDDFLNTIQRSWLGEHGGDA